MRYTKIKNYIEEAGYTQAEVAKILNVTNTTFSKKVNTKIPWQQREIEKLVNMFDIPHEQVYEVFFKPVEIRKKKLDKY